MECMASSDNVVRAGFTPKFKDVPTLTSMLTYSYAPIEEQKMTPTDYPYCKFNAAGFKSDSQCIFTEQRTITWWGGYELGRFVFNLMARGHIEVESGNRNRSMIR